MMDRYRRSLRLAKASFAILQSDRQLLIFPLVSLLALVVVGISFFVPLIAIGYVDGKPTTAGYVIGFLFYVVSYSVTFYFQTALVGAAMLRLDGKPATAGDGLRIASSRLGAIVAYAILAATVGMVLRAIAERSGILGQIVIGIIGFAWSVATFLVVPVLTVENLGPIAALKRSAELLKKTWGEQLLGNAGIGVIFGLLMLLTFIVAGILAALVASISVALVFGVIVAGVVVLFALGLISSALQGIYTASLYRYATQGDTGPFGSEAMTDAFKQRSGGLKGFFGGSK